LNPNAQNRAGHALLAAERFNRTCSLHMIRARGLDFAEGIGNALIKRLLGG